MLSVSALEPLGFSSPVLTSFVLRPRGVNHWNRVGGTGNGFQRM